LNVSSNAKAIANFLQDYARKSELDVYDRVEQKGFFRLALVRTLQSGQCMVMLQVNPTDISPEDLEKEKQLFTECLLGHETVDFTINSIYWQESTEKFNGIKDDMPMTLLHGTPQVVETLMGLQFEISPTSFFQVNPPATELLYNKIKELSLEAASDAKVHGVGEDPGVVLLDLCSGTGTIGISMAKSMKKVIGVELCPEAVEDAKRNTTLNGLENVFSLQGKVEEKMHGIFKYHILPEDTVIAVLDPPRSGVHYSVIKSIRDCPSLNHIVFVACDFNQSLQNIVEYLFFDVVYVALPPTNTKAIPLYRNRSFRWTCFHILNTVK
jgi:tRNA (uracil-5-)-methyltransferase